MEALTAPLLSKIRKRREQSNAPLFIALDGRSGSGKSTLAAYLAETGIQSLPNVERIAVIEGDEFYSGGNFDRWASRAADINAHTVIDWEHQRRVLQTIKSDGIASWQAFDWHSEHWNTDAIPYCSEPSSCAIESIVLLEGVYSARPHARVRTGIVKQRSLGLMPKTTTLQNYWIPTRSIWF